ncbi:tetratricopeptide repeat protein [Marinobacter caseinilyticus]|uniref:tetratricopeptide repeat protein n=1 Tax=Marinobacter caseinilyticus TaxID=2692195 RepID=UPI00140E698D|nr:tetratricopeptide repeat protein [Marinobacter caseinilyticus]
MCGLSRNCQLCWVMVLVVFSIPSVAENQRDSSREMIQLLDAYAVYKMGQYDEAHARFMALAKAGNTRGMLNLGNMYGAGQGKPRDNGKALFWYRKAADAGDSIGMYEVAKAYGEGIGTESDSKLAERWYMRSADRGNDMAQWTVGRQLYDRGEHQRGLFWIRRASEDGSNPAAGQFLRQLAGGGNVQENQPDNQTRIVVMDMLADIDEAASERDVQGIVAFLSEDAVVKIRLPDQSGWDTLTRSELETLWQTMFNRSGHYQYERAEPELWVEDGMVMAQSMIRERLGEGENYQSLTILEQAQLMVSGQTRKIQALQLDIRRID